MLNGVMMFAEEAGKGFTIDTSSVVSSFTDGISNLANTFVQIGMAAVPFIIGICGFFAVVRFGPKVVKMLKG